MERADSKSLRFSNKLKLRTLDLLHVVAAHILGAKAIISFDKDIIDRREAIKAHVKVEVILL